MSSDILNKIVAVKHEEVAAAEQRLPLPAMRADAESRVLTRDFEGALRAKIAKGQAAHLGNFVAGYFEARTDWVRARSQEAQQASSELQQ